MLIIYKQKFSASFIHINHRNFAQKHNLTRFKKLVETPNLKDFTKSFTITSALTKRMDEARSDIPFKRLSKTLKSRNTQDLKFSPVIDFPKDKKIFNQFIRKEAINVVKAKEDEYDAILESRLFKYLLNL